MITADLVSLRSYKVCILIKCMFSSDLYGKCIQLFVSFLFGEEKEISSAFVVVEENLLSGIIWEIDILRANSNVKPSTFTVEHTFLFRKVLK